MKYSAEQITYMLAEAIDQNREYKSWHCSTQHLMTLVEKVVAEEREVVANWIMDRGFATGHGDSIVDLLDQLEWQIAEKEREACAKICEPQEEHDDPLTAWKISEAIRARGEA